jgi:hypothetical protein
MATQPKVYAQFREDPIVQADRLIAAMQYNEAILYLTDFIKQYPNRFDEAQTRLRIVIQKREAYNRKAAELMKVLVNDPTNEERKLVLIKELEALDTNPNKEIKDAVAKTKAAALFVHNKAEYERTLAQGRALIDQARYAEATKLYEAGFVLYRQEFDEGSASDLTKKAVAGLVDRIKDQVQVFADSQAPVSQAVALLQAAFARGDPVAAQDAWPAAETALKARARSRDLIVLAGRSMVTQFEAIQKLDNTATDNSFLPFAYRFTLGRSSSPLPEGIIGAMDSQWIGLQNDLETAFTRSLEGQYAAAETAYDAGQWEDAATALDTVVAFAKPGLASLGLWSLLAPSEMLGTMSAYGRSVVQGKTLVYERARELALTAASTARIARLEARTIEAADQATAYAAKLGPASDLAASLASLSGSRKLLLAIEAELATETAAATALDAELARWTAAGLTPAGSARTETDYQSRLAKARERARGDEVAVVVRAFGFEYGRLEAELASRSAELAQARLLLEGGPQPAGTAAPGARAEALLAHYPGKSMAALATLAPLVADYRNRLTGFQRRLAGETDYLLANAEVRGYIDKTAALLKKVDAIDADSSAILAKAREQKRLADSARAEADTRIQQARVALAVDDFDTARDRLSKAADKYLAALSYEENPDLRSSSDAAKERLALDIRTAENTKVVRETRALISSGKTAYFQGAFPKAEDVLLQAQTTWKTTNSDPEPEVELWLRRAQTALSVNTGRNIAATAPLYPEMSQLLSLARTKFDQGKTLLDQRKRESAMAAFKAARDSINQVLVVFPLNQEASVLALRIDQVQDPAAFKLEFAAKYKEARAGIKDPTNEIYALLQTLATIDPGYPGLKDAIYQVELGLGIRLAPPDPAKIRRARDLIAAAKSIVDKGDTGQFSIALSQINEAITLDPNNDGAFQIKDRILTFQGGTAQIVLSSAAEELYRQAVQEFQNGNFLQANAIVSQLLVDAKNAKSQKIVDLSKKIKARL